MTNLINKLLEKTMRKLLTFFAMLIMSQQISFAQFINGKCESGDCENGFGIFRFDNGVKYEGNWKNSKFHGEGIYSFLSGNYFEGQFVEGKRHGKGNISQQMVLSLPAILIMIQ